MFSSKSEIAISQTTPSGVKHVVVNFPTDEQWCKRSARIKMITRSLGRGKSTSETLNPEKHNAELFAEIRVSGDELDPYEASKVINRLARAEVVDTEQSGAEFTVTLDIPNCDEAKHVIGMPSAKQVANWRRAAFRFAEGRRNNEFTSNLHASGDLYDECAVSNTGYESEVPVIHKSIVISEVISMIDSLEDDADVRGF